MFQELNRCACIVGKIAETRLPRSSRGRPRAALVVDQRGNALAGKELREESVAVARVGAVAMDEHQRGMRTFTWGHIERAGERDSPVAEPDVLFTEAGATGQDDRQRNH